ncbi:MAG: acyl-CoA dehydrogenase family protein [Myxococcales bacterium]|nr:MAG: acyl-CoA dehydrogenase family protein [Myxococcales bacterium]
MSSTRESSFMKSVFHGVIAEDLVFPFPELDTEEKDNIQLILANVRKFAESHIDAAAIDREHAIPKQVLEGLKEMGLFGLSIPEEYDGIGLSNTAYARVMQEVATIDSSLAVSLGAHQSIGLKAIVLFGTEAQKKKYLPRLATGECIAAFALTEPGAGSDAASITTKAELSSDGEHYILNGSKIWITNGGFADVFTVFARTNQNDESSKPRITALIVERGEGLSSGPNEDKLGIRGSSTTEIFFEDVKVPAANVIGETGHGFKVAMEVLNNGRLGLAAGCVGGCRMLLGLATERVNERHAFGRPIGQFDMIKEKIANMAAETYALESMTYLTTGLIDSKRAKDYSLESAICKVFGSETLWRVVNETLQIAAGIGYMSEYPYERYLRDARINMIFEGTNEILRAFIALSGIQGPGKQLKEVTRAIREPIKGFGLLSDFAIQRARSALGRERLNRVHPSLKKEAVLFEECTAALARETERILFKHGKDITDRQFAQRRIAEVAIDLFGIVAVLSRTTQAIEQKGEEACAGQIDLCKAFCAMAEARLSERLRQAKTENDELLKQVAKSTYEHNGYPYDII